MPQAPGYVDLQVNGYAGVDFNQDDLSAEDLNHACRQLVDDGVEGVLATIITDEIDLMAARLRRIAEIRANDSLVRKVVWGAHIEGPFINPAPGYVGAHRPGCVRPADPDGMSRLLEAADGLCRLVTLAPENDPGLTVTRMLDDQGVLVSAGHSDASLEQLKAAIDAGLSMFTHVGNGCPMRLERHDNIVQRALSLSPRLWCCFIADGVHVPFVALGNYLRAAGVERSIVVTDAIAAAGLGPGRYELGGQAVEVGDDLVGRFPGDDSHLAGSAATMQRAAENLDKHLLLGNADIEALTSGHARRLIEISRKLAPR
ncbi:MAG: amidohydrolase family protein [Phycisphaerae bacterium]|nr:amidohydrolase family protein [Phycisphaerae bacterium]